MRGKLDKFANDYKHIISVKTIDNHKVIQFNDNADSGIFDSFKQALNASIGIDGYQTKDMIFAIPKQNYQKLDNNRDFFENFYNAQYQSFYQMLSVKSKVFDGVSFSKDANDQFLILKKTKNVSPLRFQRLRDSFTRYSNEISFSSEQERALLKTQGFVGPKTFCIEQNQSLVQFLKENRGQGRDQFLKALFPIQNSDILFFNRTKFTKEFPEIYKSEKSKSPEAKNIDSSFPLNVLLTFVGYTIAKGLYSAAKRIFSSNDSPSRNRNFDTKSYKSQYSDREILENIKAGLESDLKPLQSLCPDLVALIRSKDLTYRKNSLMNNKKNPERYEITKQKMETSYDNQNIATFSKGITSDKSTIKFFGDTKDDAEETILHELMHVVAHKFTENNPRIFEQKYQGLLQKCHKELTNFFKDRDITFMTQENLHIKGEITHNLDYHKDDGLDYLSNLLPKISQAIKIDKDGFEKISKDPKNPVNQLLIQLNTSAKEVRNKESSIFKK
ncbi:MAG: hypothetical protein ISQ32_00835 [Rickettsiales bacterium]|nr:hypothetical protein [Rickettsiales bacterium]